MAELSERYGLAVDPDAIVEDLPVGVQQRVEILKALYRDARCLILDEPTAVLTPTEIDELMDIVRQLAEGGRSIIFISHKLREVLRVADRITVLRGGKVVGYTTPAEADEQALATMMVGRDVQLVVDKEPAEPGEPVLEVNDLVVIDDRGHRSSTACRSRSGRARSWPWPACRATARPSWSRPSPGCAGPRPARVARRRRRHRRGPGPPVRRRPGPRARGPPARRAGRVVPGRRQPRAQPGAQGPVRPRAAHRPPGRARHAERLVDEFDVRTPSIDAAASTLSGGNQQKVIIAREFFHADRLLVLSQPTRGLDVGSIQYIHRQVVAKRDEGVAVLLNSSELDEVLALADRIAVMYRGRIVGVLDRADASRERIGLLMAGAVEKAAEVEPVERGRGDGHVSTATDAPPSRRPNRRRPRTADRPTSPPATGRWPGWRRWATPWSSRCWRSSPRWSSAGS